MAGKTETQVVIGGKVLTLSGFESAEYQQKVASYLNSKIEECERVDGFKLQPLEIRSTMLELNLADDYFKMKQQCEDMERELHDKEKEVYDLKHELISTQMKLDASQRQVSDLQTNMRESARKIARLEADLKDKQ